MKGSKPIAALGLLLVLVLEFWIFSGSFAKFFNHDSIFYMIHSPASAGEAADLFLRPDEARQYRPLTLVFTGLLKPLLGIDPRHYHWIPIAFHILNTCLVYLLLRRVLTSSLSVLAGTAFWGLHSVAGWITYDITYLSDFMMASLLLGSLVLAIDYQSRRSWLRVFGALALFVAALFTKEAAMVFPLALFLCLVLADRKKAGAVGGSNSIWPSVKKAIPLTYICILLSLAQAAVLLDWFQQGLLYAQGSAEAYNFDPWANLSPKTKYIYWALNLPDTLHVEHPNRNRYLALVLMGGVIAAWAVHLGTRPFRLSAVEWAGIAWFAGMNMPALLLSNRLGKWYLYVPLVGVAMMFGYLAERLRAWAPFGGERADRAVVFCFLLVPVLFSTSVQTRSFLAASDSSYASDVVLNCVEDFRNAHPILPEKVSLYVLPTFEKNVADFFGGGRIYGLYYPRSSIEMYFADKGHRLPEDFRTRTDFWILQYLYGHVYDVTDYFKGRGKEPTGRRVIRDLESIRTSVSRDEFYPSYEQFQTPGGKPAFFPTPGKEILSQISGSTALIPLGEIPEEADLFFEISWMFDAGDGGWAELGISADGRETVLFRQYMRPNPKGEGLRWEEVRIALGDFAKKNATLSLKCYNNPGNTTLADWLNWRDMVLESPHTPVPAGNIPRGRMNTE